MLIEKIKQKQIEARKNRDVFNTGVLTTLLGEAEKIGKDDGNRKTSDIECTKIIKKFIKNINETLKLTDKNSNSLHKELEILNQFLPDEISDDEIKTSIDMIIVEMKNDIANPTIAIGTVMKIFKSKHIDDNYDGKTVSSIIRNTL